MLLRPLFRSCSSISSRFSEEEIQAILELKRRAEEPLSKSAQNLVKNRDWARAPIIEVSGKMPLASWNRPNKRGKRFVDADDVDQPIVRIRWAEMEERDVDIILAGDETLYTVEVKAVLYGIIQAIQLQEPKIRLRNSNSVVVKVANGNYKASKETARFSLIHRVMFQKEVKNRENQLKAKLEHIADNDKGIRRIAAAQLTENEFFEKYKNSIDTLKSYV